MTGSTGIDDSSITKDEEIHRLQARIEELEYQVEQLTTRTIPSGAGNETATSTPPPPKGTPPENINPHSSSYPTPPSTPSFLSRLPRTHIERYSRQLLCGAWDTAAQERLSHSTVLVVGAGGIGSAVLPYLCGAGVGTILIADHDIVDVSNLHRQVLHVQPGKNKAASAAERLRQLNPLVRSVVVVGAITLENVDAHVARSQCVVDASDNPATRYLLNAACRLHRVPLVSASAVQTTAQLTVYHYCDDNDDDANDSPTNGGDDANNNQSEGKEQRNHRRPCYECLYPLQQNKSTSNSSSTQSCSDVGVLGPVPGVVGTLQAMEALKILTGFGQPLVDHVLLYDATECTWMRLRKPGRVPRCVGCNSVASLCTTTGSTMTQELHAPETFSLLRGPTGCTTSSAAAPPSLDVPSISIADFYSKYYQQPGTVLLDVRVPAQYELCHLPGAISLPLADWQETPPVLLASRGLEQQQQPHDQLQQNYFCLCRRGIASHHATRRLRTLGVDRVVNIRGGLDAWRAQINPSFPQY